MGVMRKEACVERGWRFDAARLVLVGGGGGGGGGGSSPARGRDRGRARGSRYCSGDERDLDLPMLDLQTKRHARFSHF